MTAVTTSIIRVVRRSLTANTAPAAAGAAKFTSDCMAALRPLYRMSWSSGTSWGMAAFTAGAWMPAPRERRSDMTSRPPSRAGPDGMWGSAGIIAKVAQAIRTSAPMMSAFLLYRSAQTPPKKETRNCGR